MITVWESRLVDSADEAVAAADALGYPVILKTTSPVLRHQPGLSGVRADLAGPDVVRTAMESMRSRLGPIAEGSFLVQKMAPPGVSCVLSSVEDPLFGPVVSFGISGPLTELLADKAYRIPPLTEHDARAMTREIKSSPMLFGYRGSEVVDVDRIEELILLVARLKNDLPQLHSVELPLVLAGKNAATVLTASARVEPVSDARSDWFVRRLNVHPGDTLPD